jgi:hypothetical protein
MRRHPRLLAVAALALLLVAGCGGDPKPKSLPSPTPSPSPSASASAPKQTDAPSPPKAAKNRAGAIAFANFFIELVNYSSLSGDTTELRRNYVPLCTKCEAFADVVDKTYASGGKITGGDWHAVHFKYYGIRNQVAFVDAVVDFDAQSWVKRAGTSPVAYPAKRNNLKAFNLRWRASGDWAVSALDPNS